MPYFRHSLFLTTAVLLLVLGTSHALPQQLPPVEELLKRVVARAQYEKKNDPDKDYLYDQKTVSERFAKDGTLEKREAKSFQSVLINGHHYQRLIEVDGKPLSESDLKKEQEREKKFRDPKPDDDKDSNDERIELNEELLGRYQFHVINQENVGNRPAYQVTFLPHLNAKLPEKRRIDKILNRLEGRVWIDTATAALVKVEMHLTEPTTMAAGLGSISELDFKLEMLAASADIFLPSTLQARFAGRKLFSSFNVKQSTQFLNHRRGDTPPQKKGTP